MKTITNWLKTPHTLVGYGEYGEATGWEILWIIAGLVAFAPGMLFLFGFLA